MKNIMNTYEVKADEQDRYCGTGHAAKLLGLSTATVQKLVDANKLIAWKTEGAHRRISLKSIINYKNNNSKFYSILREVSQVLIIEDDINTRNMYAAYFGQWNLPLNVVIYASALDALIDLHSLMPMVLLTDLHMSKMDGFEFINTVRKNPKFSELPIIAITGMTSDQIHSSGGLDGDVFILNKPIDMDWLKEFLLGILSMQSGTNDF
jgi:excisionase family DNA binding protein